MGPLRRPEGEQAPSPAQVVCFVNHRLTVSSLVSSLVSSPVVAGHAHTRTLGHRTVKTGAHTLTSRSIESYRGATGATLRALLGPLRPFAC